MRGGPRIAVSLIGPTPLLVQEAHDSWLPRDTPQAHSGDVEDLQHDIWYVERQCEFAGSWSGNHNADNRVLKQVLIANRTLASRFDWLVLGDADTCFNLPRLSSALVGINSSKAHLLGVPYSPSWCGSSVCCNAHAVSELRMSPWLHSACCAEELLYPQITTHGVVSSGDECRVPMTKVAAVGAVDSFAPGLSHAPSWYHGGSGVLISRGLLQRISAVHRFIVI